MANKKSLTEEQLLLLNNLVYRKELSDIEELPQNNDKTVRAALKKTKRTAQQHMNSDEWAAIYKMAQSDPEILDLEVTNVKYDSETGARMACFVNPKTGEAVAVFAGTGANEWRDNTVGGAVSDTPQQRQALEWFNQLPYRDITVTGHSKGGNKAMYVFILSDKAKSCYAFDGQGFSNEFLSKYMAQIAAKKANIYLISNYRDFVNILLNPITDNTRYIVNVRGINGAAEYHCPNALFKYNVLGEIQYQIGEDGWQDPAMEMLHDFTVYLVNNATEGEKRVALSVLGEFLTKAMGGDDAIVREDILNEYGTAGAAIVVKHLTVYLQKLKWQDWGRFKYYMAALNEFGADAIGGFWGFILGSDVGNMSQFVFEFTANGGTMAALGTYQFISGYDAITIRDFSQSMMEKILSATKETEEVWWNMTKWTMWYEINAGFGGLQFEQHAKWVDDYQRELININERSVANIQRIFDKVYEIDGSYAKKMVGHKSAIGELTGKLKELAGTI